MKTWQQRTRAIVIALASFVLLITVLPEIASGLGLTPLGDRLAATTSMSCRGAKLMDSSSSTCCPGSSGSSSTTCPPGTVSGSVKITGAPKGFTPAYEGAGGCPDTGPPGQMCANPVYALATDGNYTLSLAAGKWRVAGFYEINALGGAFLGSSVVVHVPSGGKVTLDLTVPYTPPAALKGKITVRNVPDNDPIYQLNLIICPSYAPYSGGQVPIACVNAYAPAPGPSSTPGSVTGSYSLTGLPPVQWTGYVGFCAESGCTINSYHGTTFTLNPGETSTVDFSSNFLLRDQALLTGTIAVTGAPPGFSDPVGISACESGSGSSNCQVLYEIPGGVYNVVLNAGIWNIKGFYLSSPYDNVVDGPTQTVSLSSRQVMDLPLNVPYQVPGTATGTITVDGLPAGVKVTAYTMLACPISEPWSGGLPAPECVSEYSGPGGYGYGPADHGKVKSSDHLFLPPAGVTEAARHPYNTYVLPTLTSGTWLLYPGYQSVFGSVVDPSPRAVSIDSDRTTTKNVSLPYQQPSQGAVTGTVVVIGAPANGFQSGVEACTVPPTSTSCPGEVDAYSQQNGSYTMLLAPGTWWLSGFVEVYGSSGVIKSTSSPRAVQIVAGAQTKRDFTVTAS